MAGITLETIGINEVIGKLGTLNAQMAPVARQAVNEATNDALDASLPLIPVRTGKLKGGQQTRFGGGETTPYGDLFNDTYYARWVNFGHHTRSGSWVAPQDFMTMPFAVGTQSLYRRLKAIF